MRFVDSAFASLGPVHASTSRNRPSYLAAAAVGAVTLFVGSGVLAADTDPSIADSSSKAVSKASEPEATAPEATGSHEAAETAAPHNSSSADHHRGTESKHKPSSKHNSGANSEVESEIIVEGKQPDLQPHCVPVQATGSRLRKTVCTTPSAQKAGDKNAEQQAQDYLRRLSTQGSLSSGAPSPYITGGP